MRTSPSPENTTSAWWMVPVCAVLLVLRKPWALHTPQFWAEDGEIFMKQDDAAGAGALLVPYNGYLHMLPRLIAWFASRVADPAWWPAIYNGLAYAITVALFARIASRRVELPGKPWLMLALVAVVGTNEVLINVTNLQWVTAFFLVVQVFTSRPTTFAQRAGDLAIAGLVGLNGPFAIVFLPLFAWRAWRDRNLDAFLVLGVVGACAAIQGWLLSRTAVNLQNADAAFRPFMFFSIIGSRLVTWPILGPWLVPVWPLWLHAVLGVVVIGALLVCALRNDARRSRRAPLVAAFGLVVIASLYRARADTWADDNLADGDRYFYIPRVLLAWLLILQFDAVPRVIAYTARALCIVGLLTHAPRFMLPAPKDYRWAEHCDPIRRGEPANIPTLPEGWWIEYPGRPKR